MARKKSKAKVETTQDALPDLVWLRASYHFHTYAYRDPRSAFASGTAVPVVSPTTVLLGIVSTLFFIGEAEKANEFLSIANQCEVLVDAPNGIIFFRAFHQLRRYHTVYKGKDKKNGFNPRYGFTLINQGTRECGLVDGQMTLYVGVPESHEEAVHKALTNLRHLGTHDSLCSLVEEVERCKKPESNEVLYMPSKDMAQEARQQLVEFVKAGVTMVTLSRFKKDKPIEKTLKHWHLSGGQNTELITYAVLGSFQGTVKGKIYRKHRS
jgi:hypothetical protein